MAALHRYVKVPRIFTAQLAAGDTTVAKSLLRQDDAAFGSLGTNGHRLVRLRVVVSGAAPGATGIIYLGIYDGTNHRQVAAVNIANTVGLEYVIPFDGEVLEDGWVLYAKSSITLAASCLVDVSVWTGDLAD